MQKKILVFIALLVCGVTCLTTGSGYVKKDNPFKVNGVKTLAEVVKVQDEPTGIDEEEKVTVWVSYTVDGKTYEQILPGGDKSDKVGDEVSVYYLKNNPSIIGYPHGNSIYAIVCYLLGIILLVADVFAVLIPLLYGIYLSNFKNNGKEVNCDITSFTFSHVKIFGLSPATITCVDEMGNTYTMKFLYNYKKAFESGTPIKVYVHQQNPSKYKIDV